MSLLRGIKGEARNVKEILSNKFKLDFYQREYKWQTSNLIDLLEDLTSKFLSCYDKTHERIDVKEYSNYFLGPIVICKKKNGNFVIDGQQRLTTLTLLLMHINHLQNGLEDRKSLDNLIFSESFGRKSFNLDVTEREECMTAVYKNELFDVTNQSESVQNVYSRYQDIRENFPEAIDEKCLLHFVDWLLEKVEMVEITAYNDEDAYEIFETMNDRGMSLTPTDMLKGYLLANMSSDYRISANELWRNQIGELIKIDKDEEIDFFKVWLRAKYAKTIRERKKGAVNQDFENINSFHRWVRNEKKRLGLNKKSDFQDFVMNRFRFFSNRHIHILKGSRFFEKDLEYVYYNASNTFTLQYPLLLAPLQLEDDLDTIKKKIRLVAGYIDIFIARRVWNQRTLGYSSIVYTMFNLIRDIRDRTIPELANILTKRVKNMEESFSSNPDFSLNQQNRRYVHRLLARITYHVEEQSGVPSNYEKYISREIKKPFEIEHIWADKFEYHKDEFDNTYEFDEYRNHVGGLLLVQRGFNQSYKDLPYGKKLSHYLTQNLLAKSLHPNCYQKNPSLIEYIEPSGLPFKAHKEFDKKDLDERQELYSKICGEIWSPKRFYEEVEN